VSRRERDENRTITETLFHLVLAALFVVTLVSWILSIDSCLQGERRTNDARPVRLPP